MRSLLMKRKLITFVVLVVLAVLLALLFLLFTSGSVKSAYGFGVRPTSSPAISTTTSLTPTLHSSPTSGTSDGSNTFTLFDPHTLLDGIVGAVITAIVAIGIVIFQTPRTAKAEQEKLAFQIELERERIRFQDEIAAARATRDKEEQRKETEQQAAKLAMLRARNIDERVAAYRRLLHEDPRIARLQILDMSQPLEVTNVYIRVRLHQEARPGYELDVAFREAEGSRSPNELLKMGHMRLESRVQAAIDPDEAIRRYRHCVIVGDPGAGKTTLLKYLTLRAVDNSLTDLPDLPIHVELHAFANSGYRDPLEFAASVWEERYEFPKAEALEYMKERLKEGRAMLLLDALDETVTGKTQEESEKSYRQVANAIVDIKTRYSAVPMVVTARKAGYHQRTRLAGFTELEVLDFRPEDISQFVEKWFACHPHGATHGSAEDLKTRLQRSPRIQALAANPLLLSLIVLVYEGQMDLPDRRAELYKLCVETLLTKWDASRDIQRRREFKPEHKRQLLAEVAWHFHLQGQRYFPEHELLKVIADFLPAVGLSAEQNGQVLAEIAAENGLLKEQAHGWHGFLHLTLQEYFVALYEIEHNELDTLLVRRGEPWWEEVILLYAGQTADASPLLQRLLGQAKDFPLREDIFLTNLMLVGRCLAARPTVRQTALREEITSRLFDTLLQTKYPLTREQATETLAEIGRPEVNKHLLSLLTNEQLDSSVRGGIARALGMLGDRSIIPALLPLLTNEQLHSLVRGGIAQALGMLGDRSVIPTLLPLLSNEQLASSVRGGIAQALGTLGDRSVISTLLPLLSNEQLASSVHGGIARALGMLGDRSVIPTLLSLLSNEQLASSVRGGIAWALGMLGDRSVIPTLLSLLSNEQLASSVRLFIAQALGQVVDDEANIRRLAELMQTSSVADDIHRALWTISRQVGVRIFMVDGPGGGRIEVVRWGDEGEVRDEG